MSIFNSKLYDLLLVSTCYSLCFVKIKLTGYQLPVQKLGAS